MQTQYDATMPNVDVAYKPESLTNTFGEYISNKGLTQLRIAETEKYAHVTFFFNGGVEKQYPGEDRILVKSPAVATYDLQPEMSAYEVTDKMVEAVKSGKYDALILNYANCDMVGHTGVFEAAVKAVEAVDTCVGRVVEAVKEMGRLRAAHRRPRQRRPDGGRRRHSFHRSHHQSCALLRHQPSLPAAGRRPLGGHRPHHAESAGLAPARRDDRREHHPVKSAIKESLPIGRLFCAFFTGWRQLAGRLSTVCPGCP